MLTRVMIPQRPIQIQNIREYGAVTPFGNRMFKMRNAEITPLVRWYSPATPSSNSARCENERSRQALKAV